MFQGGFLGLDNIGVFNRSEPLPGGGFVEQGRWHRLDGDVQPQPDGDRPRTRVRRRGLRGRREFWEHFLYIANAINHLGADHAGMWDEADGFYYDVLHLPDGRHAPLKVRSSGGLIPLFAVETLEPRMMERMPGFARRMRWFIEEPPRSHPQCPAPRSARAGRWIVFQSRRPFSGDIRRQRPYPGLGRRRFTLDSSLVGSLRGHQLADVLS